MHEIKWVGEAPALEKGATLVTVRLGDKHADLPRGSDLSIVLCKAFHAGECGEDCLVLGVGKVRAAWHGPLSSVPLKFAEREVDPAARSYDGLRTRLESVYGRKIKEREHVTCLAFTLEAVFEADDQ